MNTAPGEHVHLGRRREPRRSDPGARVGTQIHLLPRITTQKLLGHFWAKLLATPQKAPSFFDTSHYGCSLRNHSPRPGPTDGCYSDCSQLGLSRDLHWVVPPVQGPVPPTTRAYRNLGEDVQKKREYGQVELDTMAAEALAQVLRHGEDARGQAYRHEEPAK